MEPDTPARPAAWPWAHNLCRGFLICKTGMMLSWVSRHC